MNEELIISGRMNPYIDPQLNIWHWQIPTYLFLGGLAAGILFFSALFYILRKEDEFPATVKWAPVITPFLLIFGLAALFIDLNHKLYFWRLYTSIKLRRRGEEMNLIMCGDGPELAVLREAFEDDRRVRLTGRVPREDLPGVYALADLFVFPSTMDTFGMAVLEAQSCGLPALVTDVGGPQEIIAPDKTGYVLPAGRRDVWVEAVLRVRDLILQDPRRAASVRQAARHRVKENFCWDEAVDAFFRTPGLVQDEEPPAGI